MIYPNTIELEIYGSHAMFTDPEQKQQGRLCSLPVPTYEAVKGIFCSIYWYPDEGSSDEARQGIFLRKWHCVMENGIIRYSPPEDCRSEFLRPAGIKRFGLNSEAKGEEYAGIGSPD